MISKYSEAIATEAKSLASIEAAKGKSFDARDPSVVQLCKRTAELVRGASTLCLDKNETTLAIVSRAIMENLINILWVLVRESNAIDMENAAKEELARVARVNLTSGMLRVRNRNTGRDESKAFLESDTYKKIPKRLNISEKAKEAGIEDFYNVFYRLSSLDTHGHRNIDSTDESVIIQMQGIGAMAIATKHIVTKWLEKRERTDNETLRKLLGFE